MGGNGKGAARVVASERDETCAVKLRDDAGGEGGLDGVSEAHGAEETGNAGNTVALRKLNDGGDTSCMILLCSDLGNTCAKSGYW
jgi:hypothetical protein